MSDAWETANGWTRENNYARGRLESLKASLAANYGDSALGDASPEVSLPSGTLNDE